MDWQQIISLVIVALAVILLIRSFVKKRRRAALGICDDDCGCSVNELVKTIPEEKLRQLRDQQARIIRGDSNAG